MSISALNTPGSDAASASRLPRSTVPDAAEMQDRFLKLLVAQLKNQDPMNPLDNAQMTSQMAQINTVTGIERLNATVAGITAQFAAMQLMQGADLVGHEVLVPGNRLVPDADSGEARGSFDLAANAASVRVEVLSAGGQLLGTVNMGSLAAGRHDFDFDASGIDAAAAAGLRYRVVASNGSAQVAATTLSRERVQAIAMTDGALTLRLGSGATVRTTDLVAVL